MPILTTTEARSKFYKLIDEAISSHDPAIIKGKRGNTVLISEDDRHAIQETMCRLSSISYLASLYPPSFFIPVPSDAIKILNIY